jgi:hypothetical protein
MRSFGATATQASFFWFNERRYRTINTETPSDIKEHSRGLISITL